MVGKQISANVSMQHTKNTHPIQNSTSRQPGSRSDPPTSRVVWQDNPAPNPVRAASPQPVPQKNTARTQHMKTNFPRTQKRSSRKRKTVQISLWVKPGVKESLERIAMREQLSISATGAAFLEKAITSDLHEQHGALLEPLINQAIRRSLKASSNRIALLLVQSCLCQRTDQGNCNEYLTSSARHNTGSIEYNS